MRQNNRATALKDLTLGIQDVMSWNVSNMLKCNPKKTEIIHLSSHFSPAEPVPSIKVGDCPISLSNEVKDLKVTLARHLTIHLTIHHIGKMRNFLSRSTTERLIRAFVSSKLDYSKGILHGLPPSELGKLQRLQNTAARQTVRAKKSAHIAPNSKILHWLPLIERMNF